MIRMSSDDFDRLSHTSARWGSDVGWRGDLQSWRFEPLTDGEDIQWDLAYVYWLGMEFANVILARAFLESQEFSYQVLFDEVENPESSYVIVTDYETKTWAEHRERVAKAPHGPLTPLPYALEFRMDYSWSDKVRYWRGRTGRLYEDHHGWLTHADCAGELPVLAAAYFDGPLTEESAP